MSCRPSFCNGCIVVKLWVIEEKFFARVISHVWSAFPSDCWASCCYYYKHTVTISAMNIQGVPKKRIPNFIFGITSVIQHQF